MTITVSQATIDAIKSKGMSASLKAASAGGASDEFKEGVKRMYGANRMAAQNEKTMNEADTAATTAAKSPVPMPKSAPAAATRAISSKPAIEGGPVPKANVSLSSLFKGKPSGGIRSSGDTAGKPIKGFGFSPSSSKSKSNTPSKPGVMQGGAKNTRMPK